MHQVWTWYTRQEQVEQESTASIGVGEGGGALNQSRRPAPGWLDDCRSPSLPRSHAPGHAPERVRHNNSGEVMLMSASPGLHKRKPRTDCRRCQGRKVG